MCTETPPWFVFIVLPSLCHVEKEDQSSRRWVPGSLTSRDVTFLKYVITEQAGVLDATGSPESSAFNLLDSQVCTG